MESTARRNLPEGELHRSEVDPYAPARQAYRNPQDDVHVPPSIGAAFKSQKPLEQRLPTPRLDSVSRRRGIFLEALRS